MIRRLLIIACGIFTLFSLLIVQFYRLQVVQHAKWTRLARAQHVGLIAEPFRRGTFWSNVEIKGGHPTRPQPLVMDVPKWHLHIDPRSLPEEAREEIADVLIDLVGVEANKEGKFRAHFARKSRNRRLKMWLDRPTEEAILAWWFPFARKHKIARNALFFVKDYQRSYPFGKLLGQALHTIRDQKDEKTREGIPTGGLEAYFNDLLKGKMGMRLRARTPRHALDLGRVIEAPQDGADIYLTINHTLQSIAEEELEIGVKRVEAKAGWAIMMDPRNGEILALAQYPDFYPEHYRDYFNEPERMADAVVRGITHAYEPGSVMKPLTLAVALEANAELERRGELPIFSPEEKLDVSSSRFPGRRKPLKDMRDYHYLNMNMAIQKSSNIYMARLMQQVVNRLGDQWYHDTLERLFRFGQCTGLELPGETRGFLPAPGATYASGALEWSQATPYSLAIGYNLLVNSIQMLRAFSAIANGGTLIHPTLVKKIRRGDESLPIDHPAPERILQPETCRLLVNAMKYTTKPGGTAYRGDVPGYTEAGKTGTTEKVVGGSYSRKTHFTTFIAFAPAEKPEFIVLVAVDEPKGRQFGGTCGAPIFREIAKRTLDYLGIPLDDPYGHPRQDPRYRSELADWIGETEELHEMFASWNDPPG